MDNDYFNKDDFAFVWNNNIFFLCTILFITSVDLAYMRSLVSEDFANRHGMYFLQTSAKNCDNVDRLFTEIAHELLQQVTEKYFSLSPLLERDTQFTLEKIHNVLDVDQCRYQDKIYTWEYQSQ